MNFQNAFEQQNILLNLSRNITKSVSRKMKKNKTWQKKTRNEMAKLTKQLKFYKDE